MTSPARLSDVMEQRGEEFTASVYTSFGKNTINKRYMFVFLRNCHLHLDTLNLVVSEIRKIGLRNINEYKKHGKALGRFIPFTTDDSSV